MKTTEKKTVATIIALIDDSHEIQGNGFDNYVDNVARVDEANQHSLVWISPEREDKHLLLLNTKANIIICDYSISLDENDLERKILIKVKNPKATFIKILGQIFVRNVIYDIHPSAIIHPDAEISDEVHIGANSYIGKCKIGAGTVIYGNCYIYDDVQIGKNVIINAGVVIGADGFGYARDKDGKILAFPHIGGVIIGNDVSIGANTCIDKGTLGNTVIENNVKIDNLVHIAHNVVIEDGAYVIALAMIGGSARVKKNSWVSPSSVIRDGIQIGENSLVGMGAVVTKSIPDDQVWMGNPAKPTQKKIK